MNTLRRWSAHRVGEHVGSRHERLRNVAWLTPRGRSSFADDTPSAPAPSSRGAGGATAPEVVAAAGEDHHRDDDADDQAGRRAGVVVGT